MKRWILFFVIFLISAGAFPQTEDKVGDTVSGPVLTFYEKEHDFGDITQGDKKDYSFKFKNEGNEPLIFSNILTSCGCTVTSWPEEPVKPGKTGEIKVLFDSAGKNGLQTKTITVLSNAKNGNEDLKITFFILPKKIITSKL